jgi:hypothetical protein
LTGVQDKLSQALSIKPGWVLAQALQQITHMSAVIVERGITGTTLLAHPATERNQKGRIYNDLLYDSGCDEIGKPGIAEEQTRTLPDVTPVCASVSWASASIQVLNKLIERPVVQSSDRYAFPANPMNQVLGRSNVPSSRYFCIARLAQLLSKSLKQVATWAIVHFLDT